MTVWPRPSSPLILAISLTMVAVVGSLQDGESQPVMPSPLGCRFTREDVTIECHDTSLDNVLHAFKILTAFINTTHEPRSIAIKDCEIPYLPYVFPKFNETLERVHLVHSQLEYVYPDAFAHLQIKLRYLDFSHNKLHSIPYAFSTLLSLEILNLQYNQIVFIWPGPQFHWMFGLRELNLAYNQIGLSSDYVPDVRRITIKEPVVDHLYQLAQNLTLEEFNIEPISSSLEVLNLSGNKLATLPLQLYRRRLPNLKTLDLSNNLLSELPKMTTRVLPKIRRLNLRSNFIQSLGFYSLPIGLHELDLSENPLRCDCDILWLQEWVDSNKTVIFLPTCNSPSDVKGQFLLQLTNATLCGERNETVAVSHTPEKFEDFELLSLTSTPNTVKVSWRAKVNEKNDKKWKVFYRQSIDSRYKMTLNYSEIETSYIANNSTNSSKPWAYTTYVSEINNLEPNTYYIICISVSNFARFFIQPEKCQAIQTSVIVSQTSTIRVVKTQSVKTKQKFKTKTILTDIIIYPKSIIIKWDIVLLPRIRRSVLLQNTLEKGSFNSLKWIVQIRKFASFNITETEISVSENEAQSNRSFEYTISDLTPSTGTIFVYKQ
ncbi:leucine-rich repeat-containing protein 4B-like [Limulus polyphemus]|uniref:Leucine-rich repeat-containing protein 4B-like n=1 Tax=Limulus polyphemus TaxID=6850 RepID=A0ABM1TNT0_LIMPO|nr:leucine-rich repeat-containing protein 4B-like [Limulus polyphemus]